jgi:hypothetical protein
MSRVIDDVHEFVSLISKTKLCCETFDHRIMDDNMLMMRI